MTLKTLPEIKALHGLPDELTPVPSDQVLSKWRPQIHSAADGSDATISIYDVIGEDFWTGEGITSKRIAGALRSIGSKDVTVNINSPGGDFFEGIAIYNLLREHPHKVTVKVMGLAASAASVIAMAGDEIQISEIGFIMVHNAWAVAIGNRHDMRAAADTMEPFDDAMAGLYANRAGVEKAEANGWMDKETWFNGTQAVEAGLADGFLPSSEITEDDAKGAKALAAERRIEGALRRQGTPSREGKTLIAQMKSGARDAAPNATRDAGDAAAELFRLAQHIHP